MQEVERVECPRCRGAGHTMLNDRCPSCAGAGFVAAARAARIAKNLAKAVVRPAEERQWWVAEITCPSAGAGWKAGPFPARSLHAAFTRVAVAIERTAREGPGTAASAMQLVTDGADITITIRRS